MNFNNVSNTSLNTTISNEHGVKVSTIEHLMGALFGLGIDNAIVEAYDNEKDVLLAWTRFIQKLDPDIITGYNIFGFDFRGT